MTRMRLCFFIQRALLVHFVAYCYDQKSDISKIYYRRQLVHARMNSWSCKAGERHTWKFAQLCIAQIRVKLSGLSNATICRLAVGGRTSNSMCNSSSTWRLGRSVAVASRLVRFIPLSLLLVLAGRTDGRTSEWPVLGGGGAPRLISKSTGSCSDRQRDRASRQQLQHDDSMTSWHRHHHTRRTADLRDCRI